MDLNKVYMQASSIVKISQLRNPYHLPHPHRLPRHVSGKYVLDPGLLVEPAPSGSHHTSACGNTGQ